MSHFLQDLRYAWRLLAKKPVFTLIAAVTLSLGIGATTAIFSVTNALVLKPLPFENLDRLVAVREQLPNQGLKAVGVSPADFIDFRDRNSVLEEIGAYRMKEMTITGDSDPESVRSCLVSAGFFPALETNPALGRGFSVDEDQPGRDQVALLGDGLWRRRFAADSSVIGATITLDGRTITIVGIMPPHFDYPFGSELWMPLALSPRQLTQRDIRNLQVLGQLKPGVTVAQAAEEFRGISKSLEQEYPQTNSSLNSQVIPLRDQQGDFTRPLLSVLMGMAVFLLLLACANVASLLVARATARQKEIAVRVALGASRWRVIQQLMTESVLLACLAGTIGLMLAVWAVDLIKGSLPPDIARFMSGWKEMGIDGRVLAVTLAVACLTTLIFALAPALYASRPDLNETLKDGSRTSAAGSSGRRARSSLVIVEMALALVLLVGAGLMVKGFWRILNVFQDAEPGSILTLETRLPESKYKGGEQVAEFYRQAIERIGSLPEIQSVSIASNTPLNNRPNPSVEFVIEGNPPLQRDERQLSDLLVISPLYFKTIGARLLNGRDFVESDGRQAPLVAIISELAARRYWFGKDPLGQRIRRTGSNENSTWLTIVGIVSDVKQTWFDKEPRPQLYLPYQQAPQPGMSFLLRSSTDPMNLVSSTRSQILGLDRDQPIEEVKTLARLFQDETSPLRFAAALMSVFGSMALVLAAVGVYGVMSYSAEQRTNEIGIRLALGAQRTDVLQLIVGRGMLTAAIGLGIGLLLALVLSRVMATQLFGVVSLEYSILIGFVSVLAVVAFVSAYIPAHRAARLDPMIALRHE